MGTSRTDLYCPLHIADKFSPCWYLLLHQTHQQDRSVNYMYYTSLCQFQSGRTEAPASTIPPVHQRCWKSVYLVQLSKSGKYASGKIVALSTLILSNVEAPSARLLTCNIFLATLQYSDVFWATFLPEAYMPDFDSCTQYTDFQQRWTTGGIVEAGDSVLPDWNR